MGKKDRDFSNLPIWLPAQIEKAGYSSLEKFSRAAGVGRSTIYFYLQDHYRPDTQAMAKMCHVLGIPLEEGLKQYTPKKQGRPAERDEKPRGRK